MYKLKKTKFVYLKNSYHGETLGALSVTDIPLFKNQYSQIIKNHIQVDSPDWRKGKNNESPKEIAKNKLLLLKKMFEKKHSTISSIILEPLVQCATGMAMYDKEYLVAGRDYQNPQQIVNILENFKSSSFSDTRKTLERMKTLNFHINTAFGRLDKTLREIETKLNKEDEHKSTD